MHVINKSWLLMKGVLVTNQLTGQSADYIMKTRGMNLIKNLNAQIKYKNNIWARTAAVQVNVIYLLRCRSATVSW